MKNFLKKIITLSALFICFVFNMNIVSAGDAKTNAAKGLKDTATIGYGVIPFEKATPAEIIGQVVGVGLSFIAVVFFLLLLYGGFTWMMARGNEQEVEKAISLIQAAVFGLIVVMAAYAVVSFLSKSFIK
jgi:hypothetical protein